MDDGTAIKVENVSKIFRLPREKSNSIKSAAIHMFSREKGYDILDALKNISFEVKEGDFFGIVGRNGSGKSTLLKLLAGIYVPTKGGVKVNGKLVPFIELGVGFNPELTGRENVYLSGALLGFNRKEMSQMYEDIVGFAELERFMDQKLKNYSSGMQVRLAFSIAIRARGDILLLDEVLAVGDAAFQQKCFDYFETLKKEKKTVVFVSHDMSAVSRFCNKAIYLRNGEMVLAADPADIAEIYNMENIETPEQRRANSVNKGPKLSSSYSLGASIEEQAEGSIKLKFSYSSPDKEGMYIGFSIIRDGISVAELTTDPEKPLVGKGSTIYELDTSQFNIGAYQLTSVLCKVDARKLTAMGTTLKFAISGEDITRGGAMKLADTWSYPEK
jgi:ABC-type polysaccharide/polyol phosphate transport system ATPase subunit